MATEHDARRSPAEDDLRGSGDTNDSVRAGRRRRRRGAATLTAALLASACAGAAVDDVDAILDGARTRTAPARTSSAAAPAIDAAPAIAAEDSPAAGWSLDAVLERIARANPTIDVAWARLDEAEAARREAVAAYLPELSVGLSYVSTDEPAQAFGLLLDQEQVSLGAGFDPTPGSTENWRKELRLDWALLAPGRSSSRRAATEAEESARLMAEAVERRLLNAGVQAWLGLGAARDLAAVARESIDVVEQRLAQTRTREREGAALRADVLRLEVRSAAARQEAAHAELVVRRAESALNHLMGRGADAPLALDRRTPPGESAEAIGAGLPDEFAALVALAEAERRDVLAMAHRVRMVAFQSEATRAERLPTLGAFAAYDIDGPEPAIDDELDSYTVGVGLRIPFSPRTGARIRQAEVRERRVRDELRELTLSLSGEVRDAWDGVGVADRDLALAESAAGAADEAYRIVAAAHDAGAATVTDVLEAEDARRSARIRQVAARAGVQLARAKLVAATGGVR